MRNSVWSKIQKALPERKKLDEVLIANLKPLELYKAYLEQQNGIQSDNRLKPKALQWCV